MKCLNVSLRKQFRDLGAQILVPSIQASFLLAFPNIFATIATSQRGAKVWAISEDAVDPETNLGETMGFLTSAGGLSNPKLPEVDVDKKRVAT